jgi:hypothetical protein
MAKLARAAQHTQHGHKQLNIALHSITKQIFFKEKYNLVNQLKNYLLENKQKKKLYRISRYVIL